MGEQQLSGMVLVGQFFFVGYEIMDARVTLLAEHEAALLHFLFAEAFAVAFFAVHPSGDQVMLRQAPGTTA